MTATPNMDALVDIPAIRAYFPDVPASTIRWWATNGDLPRAGRDHRRRTLYRIGDVVKLAARRADRAA